MTVVVSAVNAPVVASVNVSVVASVVIGSKVVKSSGVTVPSC